MTSCLGIDTSNYTTSAAVYRTDGTGCNSSRLLNVEHGGMGLRQSAALFQHVKRLPERFEELQKAGLLTELAAVGASTRPRAVEGSYMPCFLAGTSQGQVLAGDIASSVLRLLPSAGAYCGGLLVGGTAGVAGRTHFGMAPLRRHHGIVAGGSGRRECAGRPDRRHH